MRRMDTTNVLEDGNFVENEQSEISESFVCCVCLDLLYKPIVLPCGHVSCFWCVHKSMNGERESRCPICRHPYYHFPTICQMLHFLLLKMYPVAYKRRENQTLVLAYLMYSSSFLDSHGNSCLYLGGLILGHSTSKVLNPLHVYEVNMITVNPKIFGTTDADYAGINSEEEKKMDCFSPQLDAYGCGSQAKFDHPGSSPSSTTKNPVSNSCNLESFECIEQSGPATHEGKESGILSVHTSNRTPEVTETPSAEGPSVEGKKLPQNNEHSQRHKILLADVTCTKCKQMLFHPVVLNCGHVCCEVCIINLADEMLRCQVCQSPHPRGFPKVCLALDHFLEGQFPDECAQRRDAVQLNQIKVKPETSSCSLDDGEGETINWWSGPGLRVHSLVGCDFCGMYPIIGDRYKCIDCTEIIGFDLCGDCYNTRSKLPGRFNQQHTPEHKFELV